MSILIQKIKNYYFILMIFPAELLPNITYKIIDCDISHSYLVRFIEIKEGLPLINNETGYIDLKYIADPTKHIADYSTNLLGIFKLKHLNITLTKEGKDAYNGYCKPDEEVDIPKYLVDFQIRQKIEYFTLLILDIADFSFEYNSELKLEAKCIVKHTPARWNFWHFSIHWVNADGVFLHTLEEKELRKGWGKQLSAAAKAMLVQFVSLSEPNYKPISKTCYTK